MLREQRSAFFSSAKNPPGIPGGLMSAGFGAASRPDLQILQLYRATRPWHLNSAGRGLAD